MTLKQLINQLYYIVLFFLPMACSAKIEKKIVFVITSYNNKDWFKKNLDSVFMQDYENYRIIYIDDCSPDGTGKLVEAYIKECGQEFRTTLILNTQWRSQMANHYLAVYMCDDDEIVCQLDGDDTLYDENTLNIINEAYQDNNVWLTVGRPLLSTGERLPSIRPEQPEIIEKNSYRQDGWYFNHLRTFYAWLFKQIKLEDFLFKGNFANMAPAPDVAMMYPMYEMAGKHGLVLYDLLYVVNVKNPIRQCYLKPIDEIEDLADTIRFEWPQYEPLYFPILNRIDQFENKKADLAMWVDNLSPAVLDALSAINNYLTNINTIFVIYPEDSEAHKTISHLQNSFTNCSFIPFNSKTTFFKSVVDYVLSKSGDYLIFTTPYFVIEQPRNISTCIKELEQTFAYGFYLHFSYCDELKTMCAPIFNDLIAWQPGYTQHIGEFPNALGMVLYRKNDIHHKIKTLHAKSIEEFLEQWAYQEIKERSIGLFYKN